MKTFLQVHPERSSKYGYLIGRVRVLERSLLNYRVLDSMLKAESLEQAIRAVQEVPYLGEKFQALSYKLEDLNQALNEHHLWVVNEIASHKLGKDLAQFFVMQFNFLGLKLQLKAFLARKNLEKPPIGTLQWSRILRFMSGESGEFVPEPYRLAIQEAMAAYEEHSNIQAVELVMDRFYLAELLKLYSESSSRAIRNWYLAYVVLSLLQAALRLRLQQRKLDLAMKIFLENPFLKSSDFTILITGSAEKVLEVFASLGLAFLLPEEGSYREDPAFLADIERNIDNYLLQHLKPYRIVATGPEPILGFLFAKALDIKNLRIVLQGKYFGLPENVLRQKIRECYYE
ncbi:MAG: V/A-type H+/Na+-transporting ATPase subunit [Candidatus Atribacteria bacterium]|jgi:V/A-type H+-transporting ATPase subunit C|uniref:V-type ATPase subunit n=1 Tax=Thermatribacter velox TaxID=3039681 RepID=A0ABZ2YFN3_9BACT|nr:V/A-type H+/Na+-transporting ATPase subunit [Candidatus Atribacteria bacterium]MDI3530251.1 V/A-type H+/Na+-transporting ATPase subunit [Candidatus Atribacteria bacterium]